MNNFLNDHSPVNYFIFTPPASSYSCMSFPGKLCYIPNRTHRLTDARKRKDVIVCLHERNEGSRCVLMYFHANGSDIGMEYQFLRYIAQFIGSDLMMVEYRGYGLSHSRANESNVNEDAEEVYDYLTKEMKVSSQKIIVMGRSIGTGPAIHLAAKFPVGGLITLAAYTSIKSAIKANLPSNKILPLHMIVSNRFKNSSTIQGVKCPCVFIHGRSDQVIPPDHSQKIFNRCTSEIKKFHAVDRMDHRNMFQESYLKNSLIPAIREVFDGTLCSGPELAFKFPTDVYCVPKDIEEDYKRFEEQKAKELEKRVKPNNKEAKTNA